MSVFKFKQFSIAQDACGMKLSTDATLLGAWATVENAEKILDIGTGTGVLALMSAQRNLKAEISAIEIEAAAYRQAASNFENSPWAERLSLYHLAVQDFESPHLFDSIISNPPYYPETDFVAAPDEQRRKARSTQTLPYTALLQAVAWLLHPEKGTFSLILPVETSSLFISLAQAQGLFLFKRTQVVPRMGKSANRVLLCFATTFFVTKESELILRTGQGGHDYTEAARELLKDFLIIF